ncbi:uncharacterized protein V1510DRAFT_412726 [Dipodascopsis tothii]|uniref:uncharacterized protein n=1 Tax=Dipodascopsis tothii TaxID=44089 RepID=UPI0034CD7E77
MIETEGVTSLGATESGNAAAQSMEKLTINESPGAQPEPATGEGSSKLSPGEELPKITMDAFFEASMRAGTIVSAQLNPKARKPAYKLVIDFGPYGQKNSSSQLTTYYSAEELVGRQIVAVTNLPERRIASMRSQVLVLGLDKSGEGDIVLIAPERPVPNGTRLA